MRDEEEEEEEELSDDEDEEADDEEQVSASSSAHASSSASSSHASGSESVSEVVDIHEYLVFYYCILLCPHASIYCVVRARWMISNWIRWRRISTPKRTSACLPSAAQLHRATNSR